MMDMMEMMKDLFPEGMGDGNGSFGDMFSAMASMSGGEGMSGMADMFAGMDPSTLVQFMQMFQSPSSGDNNNDTDSQDTDNIDIDNKDIT